MTDRGSTLIEVLVAMLVLTSGVLAMAQLFLVAAATNAGARRTTVVTTLAAQKLEQILSTAVSEGPESVDHVDMSGRVVGVEDAPPSNAVYTRRWSIESVSENSLVIRVRVGLSDRSGRRVGRMAGETQMLTIRNRKPGPPEGGPHLP
jgi:type IV pilus modification protein PilV